MVNILIPAMGNSLFFKDNYFPKPLIEITGKTMLELVIENYKDIKNKRFIFVFSNDECKKFHLDQSAKILCDDCVIIKLHNQTAGALCTCLMAIEYINDDNKLIIANCDQIINVDYNKVINTFTKDKADAGLITFENIHPRWSYAKTEGNRVVETAEKRPISKRAIAGLYYFNHGKDFINSAKKVLVKQTNLDGKYYISSSLNEMILENKKIEYYDVDKSSYKSFYSPQKIKEYEECLK